MGRGLRRPRAQLSGAEPRGRGWGCAGAVEAAAAAGGGAAQPPSSEVAGARRMPQLQPEPASLASELSGPRSRGEAQSLALAGRS